MQPLIRLLTLLAFFCIAMAGYYVYLASTQESCTTDAECEEMYGMTVEESQTFPSTYIYLKRERELRYQLLTTLPVEAE